MRYTDPWDAENRGRSILPEQRNYELGRRRYEQRIPIVMVDHPQKHTSSGKRWPQSKMSNNQNKRNKTVIIC